MELVIRVDLEKAQQSLQEIFKLIGDCRFTDEVTEEETAGTVKLVRNGKALVVGRWEMEEAEERAHPLDSSYRAAANARYAHPNHIEVDRFATVSMADDGAYVQGWLHVPRADVADNSDGVALRKPPQPVHPLRSPNAKAV
jgi:hypothetical protein